MTGTAVARIEPTPAPVEVTDEALRYLGLDRRKPATVALVMIAERYGLDPLLGHIELIPTGGGPKVYVTRDGYLHVAHQSGQFDGMGVDELRRSSGDDGWTCYVTVWRKDMSHPFRVGAQCKDNETQAKRGYGPEMAMARSERRTLKRAFPVPIPLQWAARDSDIGDDIHIDVTEVEPVDEVAVDEDTGEIVIEPEPEPVAATPADGARICKICKKPLGTDPVAPAPGGWAHRDCPGDESPF